MYALITGASSGIGREMAFVLARQGYDLLLVARRSDRLAALKEKLQAQYAITIHCFSYDVSRPEDCHSLCKDCSIYPVELVINNAGFGKAGASLQLSTEEELQMIDTNIKGVQLLTKAFASQMERGRILNVASIAGYAPSPLMATYAATKAYVVSYSRAMDLELRKAGKPVRISILCPGPVATEFDQVAGVASSLHAISARQCAEYAIRQLLKGKQTIIPDRTTRLMRQLIRFAPDALLDRIEYRIQGKKL